ncbi:MAG: energy transducer TonB [Deltaproteobacteria bacterium]|jgi:protein TonB|nr:energy transducer TonB [Deltaproteobacteria bacterium]
MLDRGEDGPVFSQTRWQRLALFAILAAWIHFLAFLGWEQLGFDYAAGLPELETAPRLLEMTLELNPSALMAPEPPAPPESAPPAAVRPAPAPAPALEPALDPNNPAEIQTTEPLTEPNLDLESGASLWPEEAPAPAAPEPGRDLNNTINVEKTAPAFRSYNSTVRSSVARHWLLPPEARDNFQPGRFTAVMTLDHFGQVLSILVEESSGSASLDFAAMEALRGAAPYEPFPEELAQVPQLSFRLHFDYRAVYRQAVNGRPQF